MILVITRESDAHGHHMIKLLEQRGVAVSIVDYELFPLEASMSCTVQGSQLHLTDKKVVESGMVTSVLNRREGTPKPPEGIQKEIGEYIIRETTHLLSSLPHLFTCLWVNNPDAVTVAGRKPYQLKCAHEHGLQIPETIITNSPADASDFIERLDGMVAVKTLWTPSLVLEDGDKKRQLALYTRKLSKAEALRSIKRVQNCPMIFQRYIEKAFELRITIVGTKVFTAAIHSQMSHHTKEDWRRYDLDNTPHLPYSLPDNIAEKCVALVQGYGLQFGCIDMIVTPENEYVFLELNPSGQWLWIEDLTGLPISAELENLLCRGESI